MNLIINNLHKIIKIIELNYTIKYFFIYNFTIFKFFKKRIKKNIYNKYIIR